MDELTNFTSGFTTRPPEAETGVETRDTFGTRLLCDAILLGIVFGFGAGATTNMTRTKTTTLKIVG